MLPSKRRRRQFLVNLEQDPEDIGGSGGEVVDDSGIGAAGGQDFSVAGLGDAIDDKGAKKFK